MIWGLIILTLLGLSTYCILAAGTSKHEREVDDEAQIEYLKEWRRTHNNE